MGVKIIIAGGRDFSDYDRLHESVMFFLSEQNINLLDVTVFSGGAKGADKLGERFAKEHHLKIVKYPADWDKFGKKAGFIRNGEMIKDADMLIAFWDGKSKGTKDIIERARHHFMTLMHAKY